MRYSLMVMMSLFGVISVSTGALADHARYQQTHFEITNSTAYVELVRIYDSEGIWKKSVVDNVLFTLQPYATYRNTLNSVVTHDGIENYTSIAVVKKDSPRDNYLIFGESTESWRHDVSSDIFDGLGEMFVDSQVNHCNEVAFDGYQNCKLIIKDAS